MQKFWPFSVNPVRQLVRRLKNHDRGPTRSTNSNRPMATI
jgi:hypothetical protein